MPQERRPTNKMEEYWSAGLGRLGTLVGRTRPTKETGVDYSEEPGRVTWKAHGDQLSSTIGRSGLRRPMKA